MKKKLLTLIISVSLLSACSTIKDKKSDIKLGMTKDEVVSLLGKPVEGEKYCSENVLFYYDGAKWFDGNITSDECLPLVFENDKLIGWGHDFYQSHKKKSW
ncbi:MAG TPA: DUF3192 domain-containing protein [Victivallales bacterium]|nr:DUF3192 domain-containing protein [Victivallales bacterium]